MTAGTQDRVLMATRSQLTKLAVVFAEAGYPTTKEGRARRIAFASEVVKRPLTSSAELTRDECGRLIEYVERLVGARLCGKPSAADEVAVAEFAQELEARVTRPGPPVTERRRAPGAGVGEPVGVSPAGAAETEVLPADQGTIPPHPDHIGVRRGPFGCGPGGLHWVAPSTGVTTFCPCGTVSQVHSPDRYCVPGGTCYCGTCPGYTPVPVPNYRKAIAELREKEERRRGWRR